MRGQRYVGAAMLLALVVTTGAIGTLSVGLAAPQTAPTAQTLSVTYYFLPG